MREPIRYFSECLLNTYSMPDTWEGNMNDPGNVPVVKNQTVNKPTPEQLPAGMGRLVSLLGGGGG